MTLIKRPHELNVQVKIKALIYGQAGTGKSTLALSAPKPVMFDSDNGIHRVNFGHLCPTVQVEKWEDIESELNGDLSEFETLIFDTGGKMLDYMSEYIIRKNPKMGRANGQLTLQGFGERKGMFRQLLKKVSVMNKHIIFVAHRDTQKIGDDYRYVPLFGGSSYDDLVTDLDLVGYIETSGRQRVITFDPTDKNDGKNTCNLPATINLPMVVDADGNALANTFFKEQVIKPYIANLEKRKIDSEKFNTVIAEIKEFIEMINDENGCNELIAKIDNFAHVGNSKAVAGNMLNNKAAQLGLMFSRIDKKYIKNENV